MHAPPEERNRPLLRRLWQRQHGSPSILSTARSFSTRLGGHFEPDPVRGYYIDFSFKPESSRWPPY